MKLVISFILNLDIGTTNMNMFGYGYGVFAFLAGTQVGEKSLVMGFLFALAALFCFVIAASKDKD